MRTRDIPGYGGRYAATKDGHVYSRSGAGRFAVVRGGFSVAILLRSSPDRRGYQTITLRDEAGHQRRRFVHHLVLEAFVGPRPDGHQADHVNRDPADNRLVNLRWVTKQRNMRNCLRTSRHTKYRGLAFDMRTKKPWRAQVVDQNGKVHCSVYHATDREAAIAYDTLAVRVLGAIAITNQSLGLL